MIKVPMVRPFIEIQKTPLIQVFAGECGPQMAITGHGDLY